jgi:hypothetical protein
MSKSTHIIYEHGQGFPGVGERVYDSADNSVYTVESIDSGILTRQWEANHIMATLEYECDATDLNGEEFDAIRATRIERNA